MGIKKNRKTLKKGSLDYVLLGIVLVIFAIGSISLLSASSSVALSTYGDSYYYFKAQLRNVLIGALVGAVFYFIDYRVFENKKWLFLIFICALGLTWIVKFLGTESKGAVRWIRIGGMSIQPSEFVKIAIMIMNAGYLSFAIKTKKIKNWHTLLISTLLVLIIAGSTWYTQNHMSAAILMLIAFLVQLIISGVNMKILWTAIFTGLAAGLALAYSTINGVSGGFRGERLRVWLNPFEYLKTGGWQTIQSLYAIGSGGLTGMGLGDSRQKHSYIPEPHNDFIFAIFSEELGFIGVVLVLILFFILIARGFMIARNSSDVFGKILASGIISLLGAQVVFNLAVVSNTIPVTGISLPFFSYGGSSIIAICIQIAILLNISKISSKTKEDN